MSAASKVCPDRAVADAVRAVYRINGVVLPGTIFFPDSEAQREELLKMEAIEPLAEFEAAVMSEVDILTLHQLVSVLSAKKVAR